MGVDVSKLKPTPGTLQVGKSNVSMAYVGVVDQASDNPVSLALFIEPAADAVFIDKKVQVKTITRTETFTAAFKTFNWDVEIEILKTPALPTPCSLRLEATDSKGNKSTTNSFFIYH